MPAPRRLTPWPLLPALFAAALPLAAAGAEPAAPAVPAISAPAAAPPDWLATVGKSLRDRWEGSFLRDCDSYLKPDHPLNNRELRAVVVAAVDPAGALVEVHIDRTSGNADFDKAALDVTQATGRFSAPPEALRSDDDRTYLAWTFARTPAPAAAGPELRRVVWPLDKVVPKLLAEGRFNVAAARLAAAGTPDALPLARDVALALGKKAGAQAEAAPPSAEMLAAVARESAKPRAERVHALETLGALPKGNLDAASPALRKSLDDPDTAVRAAAARAYARLGRDGGRSLGVFYRISPLLNDPQPEVRAGAVEAATYFAPEKGISDVLLVCKRQKDPRVIASCATALGGRTETEAQERAKVWAASTEIAVRDAALRAMASQTDSAAVAFVTGRLAGLPPELAFDLRVELLAARVKKGASVGDLTDFAALVEAATTPERQREVAGAWVGAGG